MAAGRLIAADLGEHWELENISLRLWPTGSPIQIALTALFDLIAQHDLQADEVERLRIVLNPASAKRTVVSRGREGTFQALLSAHFVAAVVLHERAAWLDQFGPSRYEDPALLAYAAERVEVLGDPALPRGSCRLEALTRDGRELSLHADVAKGDPGNRVSRQELSAKFRQCAEGRRSEREVDGLLDRLLHLEQVDDLTELLGLLGAVPVRR